MEGKSLSRKSLFIITLSGLFFLINIRENRADIRNKNIHTFLKKWTWGVGAWRWLIWGDDGFCPSSPWWVVGKNTPGARSYCHAFQYYTVCNTFQHNPSGDVSDCELVAVWDAGSQEQHPAEKAPPVNQAWGGGGREGSSSSKFLGTGILGLCRKADGKS